MKCEVYQRSPNSLHYLSRGILVNGVLQRSVILNASLQKYSSLMLYIKKKV